MPTRPDSVRILLADDEATFRQATAELLREQGFRCDEAANAAEAAEQLKSGMYDVAILDVHMPGNANLELLTLLASLQDAPPVILITGYPASISRSDGARQAEGSTVPAVVAYLIKPFRFERLLQQVRHVITEGRRS